MKTTGKPKKNISPEGDKFDRKSARVKSTSKRSSKRKLSIYVDFDEEGFGDLDFESDSFMDNPFDD